MPIVLNTSTVWYSASRTLTRSMSRNPTVPYTNAMTTNDSGSRNRTNRPSRRGSRNTDHTSMRPDTDLQRTDLQRACLDAR
jgi:hypothetical protein